MQKFKMLCHGNEPSHMSIIVIIPATLWIISIKDSKMLHWKTFKIRYGKNLLDENLILYMMIWLIEMVKSKNSLRFNQMRDGNSRMMVVIGMGIWLLICQRFSTISWKVFVVCLWLLQCKWPILVLINILLIEEL